MQESKDDYFFKKKQAEMEKLADYGVIRRWQVNPDSIEHLVTANANPPKRRRKRKSFDNGSHYNQNSGSLPKVSNSPSGRLSEKRWKSPIASVSNFKSEGKGSRNFLNERSVSKSPRHAGGNIASISHLSGSKRSMDGNLAKMISIQD